MIDEGCVIGTIPFRIVNVTDDCVNCASRGPEYVQPGLLESDLVVVIAADETIQCRGDCHTSFDVRHIGAAVQRMTGSMQFVSNSKRRFMARTGFKVICDDFEMPCRLFGEDVIEHRVHLERLLFRDRLLSVGTTDRQDCRIRVAIGERVRAHN